MTAKSQTRLKPRLLGDSQYSGTLSTLLYNWPIFLGVFLFSTVTLIAGSLIMTPWNWLLLTAGGVVLLFGLSVLIASFFVFDVGRQREYHRLAELGDVAQVNVIIDVTCGKLRGTRGMLSQNDRGHYFVLDIYNVETMSDPALRRARDMEPPLETSRRVYHRTAAPDSLPIPHNWADVVYCSFSLHELQAGKDRQAIFNEFARILKPGGKLLIAEQGRDWPNLLTFNLGALSFFSPRTWEKYMAEAGLEIKHHERWRGLVHLWVAERKSR